MARQPRLGHGQPLVLLVAAALLLVLLLASTASAFLVPAPGSIGSSSSGLARRIGLDSRGGRVAVVTLAKGRKSDRKRKGSSSSSNKPPASEEGAAESSEDSSSSSGEEEAGTFSILGSAGDASSTGKGFGVSGIHAGVFGESLECIVPCLLGLVLTILLLLLLLLLLPLVQPPVQAKPVRPAPTAKDVDDAYERALSKIKGQDRLSATPLGGGGGGGGAGGPPAEPGKAPVRNVDIFDFLPEGVQTGIETTLIGLLAANLLVIILLGIGFSVEALPTSNLDLPAALVSASKAVKPFVEQYEYLFTPALGTFFLVSTLLGSFKIAQLGKGGTTYREK